MIRNLSFTKKRYLKKCEILSNTKGRKLTSGTMNGQSFTYRYDGNGMRYKKIVGASKTDYYYNGTQLLLENRNGIRLYYIYGVTGIEGMIYRGQYYYYDKNTLGDIIAIRDDTGNVIARYTYDAWGNHKVYGKNGAVDKNKSSIGNINPFRYRGYYYDTETGFYYLQTRYYDPTICRFINADNYELVAELSSVAGQLNMYAYCNNNPIMYTDETGEILTETLILLIAGGTIGVGLLIGAVVGIVDAVQSGSTGWAAVGDVLLWAGTGVATAGAFLLLGGILVSFAGASAIGIPIAALGAVGFNVYPMIVMPLTGQKGMEPVEMKPAQQVIPMPPTTTGMASISNYNYAHSTIAKLYII